MNIKNFFNQKVAQFKQHTAEVADIQNKEGAKRDQEMKELVAYQDSYRAAKQERQLESGRQLQQDMKVHYAELDAKNEVRRKKLGKMMDSIQDFFSKKRF